MFTGIIEETGIVEKIYLGKASAVLTIGAEKVLEQTKIGDSISVNGICLTVTGLSLKSFSADVMHETLNRSSLSGLQCGSPVNLERAMPADGRFGGHIVSGHVDGIGKITIDGTEYLLHEGESIVMPAGHPHAGYGQEAFKMLLVVVF